MQIVFWRNCLCPHQLPYIIHLLDDKRVDQVVVAAGSVVTKGVKDYTLMAGVPAKQIGWVGEYGNRLSETSVP